MGRSQVVLVSVICSVTIILLALLRPSPAGTAGPYYVAPGGDGNNDCLSPASPCATINGAIGKAAGGDTIYIAVGTYTSAEDEVVLIDKDLVLSGGWDSAFNAQSGMTIIDGQRLRRGLKIERDVIAIIERFVIQNSHASQGSGIYSRGNLTMHDSVVRANKSTGTGSGIINLATLSMRNCEISNNRTANSGAGGIYSDGPLILNNCTVSGNVADRSNGGGIHLGSSGSLIMSSSTVTGNRAEQGGGIGNHHRRPTTIQNSIIAGNYATFSGPECSGDVTSAGHNLAGDLSGCDYELGSGDITGAPGPFAGLVGPPGSPRYHPLPVGSPAIDAGAPSGCDDHEGALLIHDQRGVARVGRCDIGAYEYTVPGPPVTVAAMGGTPQSTPPNTGFWLPLQTVVLDHQGSPVHNITVTFTAPTAGASGVFAGSGSYTTTAVTDHGGLATAAAFSANSTLGPYQVAATVAGVVTPAVFLLNNEIGWYVTTTGDDGHTCQIPTSPCRTLAGVLGKPGLAMGDTILVAGGVYTGSGDEVALIDKGLRLIGGWNEAFSTRSGFSIIEGEHARRGVTADSDDLVIIEWFEIRNSSDYGLRNNGTLSLNNCTVRDTAGKGILNDKGSLTLDSVTVKDNTVGAGIHSPQGILTVNQNTISGNGEAGISSSGQLTIKDSIVTVNGGGGISHSGQLFMSHTSVTDNHSDNGGAGLSLDGDSVVVDSTISRNVSTYYGGGGGISAGDTLMLTNSTVSHNVTGGSGGGIINRGISWINSSTITGNSIGPDAGSSGYQQGAGIQNSDGGQVTIQNSILAGNTSVLGAFSDCWGTLDSSGYNLFGSLSSCTINLSAGDRTNIDIQLDPLSGEPGYHPLPFDSLALDAGNPSGCKDHLDNPLNADQRGRPRQNRCDIGSYEAQALETSGHHFNRALSLPGEPLTATINLRNIGATDIGDVSVTNQIPHLLTYRDGSLTATGGSYEFIDGLVNWTGTVHAGQPVTITYGLTVTQDAPLGASCVSSTTIKSQAKPVTRTAAVELLQPRLCNLTKFETEVFLVGDSTGWDARNVWAPSVFKEGTTYMMWYTGEGDAGASQIGLATSTDGIVWRRKIDAPVLTPSAVWEAGGLRSPFVIQKSGIYKMWYTGFSAQGVGQIGYATSSDGLTWIKYDQNPVLRTGPSHGWEDSGVTDPTLLLKDDTYHMWYTGYDGMAARIGQATSSDGVHWNKAASNPVLDLGANGAWDWLHVYGPEVVEFDADSLLWYGGGTLPEAWQTGYASQVMDDRWSRQNMIIPVGEYNTFDEASADYPSVLVDDLSFKIWYSGLNTDGAYKIGYATAEICREEPSSGPQDNTVFLPMLTKAGCPAFYSDGFSNPRSGWPAFINSNFSVGYTDDQYYISISNPPNGIGITPGALAVDFVATVVAHRDGGDFGAYGIRFGINEDWSEFYEFTVDYTYFSVWKFQHGAWTALQTWTHSDHIKSGSQWNTLKVVQDGSKISAYVNGHRLTTIFDNSILSLGRVGLHAGSSGWHTAYFDDFALYPTHCEEATSLIATNLEFGEASFHETFSSANSGHSLEKYAALRQRGKLFLPSEIHVSSQAHSDFSRYWDRPSPRTE